MTTHPLAKDSAREAGEHLALAANAAPALLAYLGSDGRYVWVNEGYCQWFGTSADAIVGRHPSELLHAEAWAIARPYVDRALAGEPVTFDTHAVGKGTLRDLHVAYIPHRDSDGSVQGFVAFISDISEMKAVETALRRSERMLEHSQSRAQVGGWEVTLDGTTAQEVPGTSVWSRQAYRIMGYEPSVPASMELFYRRLHPDDREALQARAIVAVQHGEQYESDYRIVLPDGRVRAIHGWLQFEREAGGKSMRLFGTCQDVTDQKAAEIEILRAREQLQLVVDATPAYIARYDREHRLVWANKSWAARFNKTPDEVAGARVVDLVGESAFRVLNPYILRVIAGESIQIELEVPYAFGRRFMQVIAAPTYGTDGVDGCVIVLTDLTRRRQLEQERERALDELQEADRRKDEFLAMLSHELRNPLAPILNSVEILERLGSGDGADEGASELHSIIGRQARHMKRLLDDLLDASRVSHGKIQLQKERLDLRTAIEQAVEVSRPMIVEKRHALSLALGRRPLTVNADPARIVQVFANLINNAAKYTDPGGHISISSSVDDGEAVVTVRDDGIGMTPNFVPRAFDLFAQETHALDRAQGGLGIGLTLVRTLVAMHGGSVGAFSEGPARGSELVVRLPLAPVEISASRDAPALRDESREPLRALVVDDNVDAARAVGRVLRLLGHEVVVTHDGPSALAAAAAAPPDLVLLDIELPGMDGYAVAARLRETGHVCASIVAVTGYGRDADLRRTRDAGFDHHLVKPVDFTQLEKISVAARRALAPDSLGDARRV